MNRGIIVYLLALGVGGSTAWGQPFSGEYGPVGAPQNPKVSAGWNTFRDYTAATKLLEDLAKAHPNLCRLQSLGVSHGGRQLWVLTITNFEKGEADKKPAMWIDGGIHANETQATDVVLYTAWYLAESFGQQKFVDRLLDDRAFYLLPMLSPDSRDAHMYQPNTTHSPRTGQRPVDDDMDGLVDEDKPDDLDGDGHITQMRRADPHGRFKRHEKYPEYLVEVDADEKGEYTLLGMEGIDNDGDGKVNEDADGSYDPNRDWAWNWQPDYIQRGAYRYPFSLIENRLAADFIASHPNIAGAQSYHNTGGMILRGPGSADDTVLSADNAVLTFIGSRGEAMLPGYRSINIATGLYTVYGGEVDWLYAMQGIFTFTNELFTPFNFFRENQQGGFFARQETLHKFDKYLLFGDGFVPWHEVEHPQYGKIEVGGFKKNWVRQPPSFLIEEECHRNMAFTLYHADQMPLVGMPGITTRDLGQGLIEVTATVSNQRVIPTRAAQDVAKNITRPDHVKLASPNAKVLASLYSTSPTFEHSTLTKDRRDLSLVKIPSIPGMGAMYVRWIVQGAGPFTVTVDSVKGSQASATQ